MWSQMRLLLIVCTLHIVSSVDLVINPTYVTVIPDTAPSAAAVNIQCRTYLTFGIQQVYSIELYRNSVMFAEVAQNVQNNLPIIPSTAPTDIRNNPPRLEGSIDTNSPGNSYLRALFNTSLLGCQGPASYECRLTYKPSSGMTLIDTATRNLTVDMVPGSLNLTAAQDVNGLSQPLANLSAVRTGSTLILTCTGVTGRQTTASIRWYWKQSNLYDFSEFPSNEMDGSFVTDTQTSYVCPYSRMTTLRVRMLTSTPLRIMFRCQTTPVSTSNVGSYVSYSEEFHIQHVGQGNVGATTLVTDLVLVISSILVLLIKDICGNNF